MVTSFSQSLTYLATVVVFLVWFRRVRLNAGLFDASAQRMAPGWAVGGWFVPVGNLWLPYQVAGGVWAASTPIRPDGGRRSGRGLQGRAQPLAGGPGCFRCSSPRLPIAGTRWPRRWTSPNDANNLVMVADLVDLGAAVLAVAFVRALTRTRGERAAQGVNPSVMMPVLGGRARWADRFGRRIVPAIDGDAFQPFGAVCGNRSASPPCAPARGGPIGRRR